MGNPVVHFEIAHRDHEALRDFYGKVFDWKIAGMEGMDYGMVDTGTPPLGGIGGGPDENYPGHVTFYVMVDDLEAKLAEIESLGGKVALPVMEVPGGPTIAQFLDPSGNMIGLIKS